MTPRSETRQLGRQLVQFQIANAKLTDISNKLRDTPPFTFRSRVLEKAWWRVYEIMSRGNPENE